MSSFICKRCQQEHPLKGAPKSHILPRFLTKDIKGGSQILHKVSTNSPSIEHDKTPHQDIPKMKGFLCISCEEHLSKIEREFANHIYHKRIDDYGNTLSIPRNGERIKTINGEDIGSIASKFIASCMWRIGITKEYYELEMPKKESDAFLSLMESGEPFNYYTIWTGNSPHLSCSYSRYYNMHILWMTKFIIIIPVLTNVHHTIKSFNASLFERWTKAKSTTIEFKTIYYPPKIQNSLIRKIIHLAALNKKGNLRNGFNIEFISLLFHLQRNPKNLNAHTERIERESGFKLASIFHQ
jgi:hypothetical protein